MLPRSTEIAKNDKVRAYSFYVKKKRREFSYIQSPRERNVLRVLYLLRGGNVEEEEKGTYSKSESRQCGLS